MGESTIPVDVFNPGQVFACLGLMEAAVILLGGAEAAFDWQDETKPRFRLRAAGSDAPVEAVLGFLAKAEVTALAPAGSQNSTAKWKIPTINLDAPSAFPSPDPPSPATLPTRLSAGGRAIVLDHWADASTRDRVKLWAGAAGYPGAALAADALELIRGRIDEAISDPFALAAPQSSSFRFDWRRDYIPLDAGFSPNDHGAIRMVGYPLVEILAAIGLTNARPLRVNKLNYRYGIAGGNGGQFLPPLFLRAALGCAELGFAQRFFHMHLGWPGQENQARCIIDVTEEPRQ